MSHVARADPNRPHVELGQSVVCALKAQCCAATSRRAALVCRKVPPTLRKRSRGLAMLLVKLPASSTSEKAFSRASLQDRPACQHTCQYNV